ncbi:MAG TPA: PDZ domain-containing protein [Pyrinomonadaceae bacterium]|nr:PDZ domain-containing protein [Pyrinomonadaceae bacterium]
MTIRKLLVTLSIILGCGLIIGGIVSAQEAPKAPDAAKSPKAPKAEWSFDDNAFDFDFDFDVDPEVWAPQGDRNFTFFFQGGTFLGVHAEDVSKENMASYGLREVRGVGVTEVVKDSPAEKAGLRKGDVIVGFNGEAVTSTRKLNRLVNESSPDQNVRLTVARGGSEQEISATLGKRDAFNNVWNEKTREEMRQKMEKMRKDMPKIKTGDGTWTINMGGAHRRIGISTQTLTKQLADYFGVTEGILVTSVVENSAAAKAGLKAGDVITAVDGEKVDSPGDISRAINKKDDGPVTLTVVRDRSSRSITVTPEKLRTDSGDIRTITIPRIEIPTVPAITVTTPQIVVPSTPDINITVPRRPVTIVRPRSVII